MFVTIDPPQAKGDIPPLRNTCRVETVLEADLIRVARRPVVTKALAHCPSLPIKKVLPDWLVVLDSMPVFVQDHIGILCGVHFSFSKREIARANRAGHIVGVAVPIESVRIHLNAPVVDIRPTQGLDIPLVGVDMIVTHDVLELVRATGEIERTIARIDVAEGAPELPRAFDTIGHMHVRADEKEAPEQVPQVGQYDIEIGRIKRGVVGIVVVLEGRVIECVDRIRVEHLPRSVGVAGRAELGLWVVGGIECPAAPLDVPGEVPLEEDLSCLRVDHEFPEAEGCLDIQGHSES